MIRTLNCFAVVAFLASLSIGQGLDDFYKLGPDSLPQEGVPQGKNNGPREFTSEAFPGTQHTYWEYAPPRSTMPK